MPFIETQREAQWLADALYALVHCLDGTRPVSGNDGWEQASTDLLTVHDYAAWPEDLSPAYKDEERMLRGHPGGGRLLTARGYDHHGKPRLLTEFGGIAMKRDAAAGAITARKKMKRRFSGVSRPSRARSRRTPASWVTAILS